MLIYNSKLEDVTDTGVKCLDNDENEQFIEADTLVFCGSWITQKKALGKEFEVTIPNIVFIGDCNQPRDIRTIRETVIKLQASLKVSIQ